MKDIKETLEFDKVLTFLAEFAISPAGKEKCLNAEVFEYGEKIKKEREEWGYTQKDMASAIPMNQSNYSKIERDLQEPSIEQLKKICIILKLDCNYLLDLDDYDESRDSITEKDLELLKDVKKFINEHK